MPMLSVDARDRHEPEASRAPCRAGARRSAGALDAQRILADEAARREALFQQSVNAEKNRGDALSKRFEEALKQANQEPITRPTRDFDLD